MDEEFEYHLKQNKKLFDKLDSNHLTFLQDFFRIGLVGMTFSDVFNMWKKSKTISLYQFDRKKPDWSNFENTNLFVLIKFDSKKKIFKIDEYNELVDLMRLNLNKTEFISNVIDTQVYSLSFESHEPTIEIMILK